MGEDANSVLDGFNIINGYLSQASGGGMYNYSGNPTVLNCAFIGNSADNGGGMYNSRSSPTVVNCTFSGNLGLMYWGLGAGGGINNTWYSSPALTNCTISGNVSGGGGIYFDESTITVNNCMIVDNTAILSGGGIYGNRGNATITSCIFSGNSAQKSPGTPLSLDSCIQNWTMGGRTNINSNPSFVDAAAGDYHLYWDSPCINAGNPTGNYTGRTDIDGDPRVVYGLADIGADEV